MLTVSKNDTSVVVITENSTVNLTQSTVIKHGYSTDLYQSSFYGLNAALKVANASVAYIDNVNVTVHNGAANIYVYGNNSFAYVSDSNLYSSGPVSHGLYAAGYGTVVGRNLRHYSGAYRSSAFAGDSPKGYVYTYDSIAHTAVIFSSGNRQSGSEINFTNSRLTVLPDDAAGLWFGNVIASASLIRSQISTTSGILVIANYSQVTQDFNYFADSTAAAEATITISESDLAGDLVAYNGSSISWILGNYSTWTGRAYSGYGNASFSVALDATSLWILTGNTVLTNFTDADTTLTNVHSAGYNLYYDSSSAHDHRLKGVTKKMSGGGFIKPATKAQLRGSN